MAGQVVRDLRVDADRVGDENPSHGRAGHDQEREREVALLDIMDVASNESIPVRRDAGAWRSGERGFLALKIGPRIRRFRVVFENQDRFKERPAGSRTGHALNDR